MSGGRNRNARSRVVNMSASELSHHRDQFFWIAIGILATSIGIGGESGKLACRSDLNLCHRRENPVLNGFAKLRGRRYCKDLQNLDFTLFEREKMNNKNGLNSTSGTGVSSSKPLLPMLALKLELPAPFEESASFPTFPRRSDSHRKRIAGRCPNKNA
jgi:hypothetical protein